MWNYKPRWRITVRRSLPDQSVGRYYYRFKWIHKVHVYVRAHSHKYIYIYIHSISYQLGYIYILILIHFYLQYNDILASVSLSCWWEVSEALAKVLRLNCVFYECVCDGWSCVLQIVCLSKMHQMCQIIARKMHFLFNLWRYICV